MPLVPFIGFFIGFFGFWVRTQGPHDPLLPGGLMSCQSAPGPDKIKTMYGNSS
ncbi:unnamed protein product [Staurois parvus]|uniref:Uncharacterized protein n=1 Tax=Staurois parvus TaxID=386267 RepID=A0ABN9CVH9_9NEOB|nr:unnamed protein product [Staurois parvus]